MGRTPPSAAELERRQASAERRQRYRGERKRPYQPRGLPSMRGRFVQMTILVTPRQKRAAKAAARRAGMSTAEWIREIIDDTLALDARSRGKT